MLKYKVVPVKNPVDGTVLYYGRLVPVVPITLHQLAENISRQCTVTIHDVKAVLSALEEQIYNYLRNGNSVRLGDVGSFRATLRTTSVADPADFTPSAIEGLRVRFRPSNQLRYELSRNHPSVQFQNIADVPATPGGGGEQVANNGGEQTI